MEGPDSPARCPDTDSLAAMNRPTAATVPFLEWGD